MVIEVHLIPNFSHGILISLDTITDYGIDFLISCNLISIGEFTYQIRSVNRKFRSILILLRSDVTVYSQTCRCIPITSYMLPGIDYVGELHQFLQPDSPILLSLSLAFAIINTSVKELIFQNSLMTPIILKKRQMIE